MNKNYCVYVHKNKINGKMYVGQTCQKPQRRWSNGYGYKQCPAFYNAINKYGWDSFEHTIVKEGLTHEEANDLEKELIQKYQTTNSDFGYNLSIGGQEAFANYNLREVICLNTKEVFNSTADAAEKYLNTRDGSHISEVCSGKRSHAGKLANGDKLCWAYLEDYLDNPDKYKNFSIKKKSNGRDRKIICTTTGEVFNTITEAVIWSNQKGNANILKVCKGERKSAGKHPETGVPLSWKYFEE